MILFAQKSNNPNMPPKVGLLQVIILVAISNTKRDVQTESLLSQNLLNFHDNGLIFVFYVLMVLQMPFTCPTAPPPLLVPVQAWTPESFTIGEYDECSGHWIRPATSTNDSRPWVKYCYVPVGKILNGPPVILLWDGKKLNGSEILLS